MTDFISCNVSDVFEANIFELNPHLKHIPLYKDLYKTKNASNKMWAIFMLESVDEEINKYIKYSLDERIEVLKEMKIDTNDELFQKCRERYSIDCMSYPEKRVREAMKDLEDRDKFLATQPYTVQWYDVDEHGNPKKAGNTLVPKYLKPSERDKMVIEKDAMYAILKRSLDLFTKEKNERRVIGGREESLSEKGKL